MTKLLFLLLLLFSTITVYAKEKTPSDIYSQVIVLKKMIIDLRKENNINTPLIPVEVQHDKKARHVLQKTLEVLTKINKYREIHHYGLISVPPVPPRRITLQNVYQNIIRLKEEIRYLLKNKNKKYSFQQFHNKTSSDVYQQLWSVSLGFDKLLGQGFTPTDVYIQSQQIVEAIKFLRTSQRQYNNDIIIPKKRENLHPNHALYASVELLKKIHKDEKKLWMKPVPIPEIEQKVISPTEVYDSLQTVKAEIKRITRRLGLEATFPPKKPQEKKTPSDVVQNLEYAKALLPTFDFDRKLNQYPQNSLVKTPNDVYALSEFILHKIAIIKDKSGIKLRAKKAPYVYGLRPIYVYLKGIENLEKVAKLKIMNGFLPSQIPDSPNRKITPSEVYEIILRLDDEINLLYNSKKYNYNLVAYRNFLDKKIYQDKTPSDVYHNLWQLSYELDTILNKEYTPNETYILASKIKKDISYLATYLTKREINILQKSHETKSPRDVFKQSLLLMKRLDAIKRRGNLQSPSITIPKDKIITPNSVYNALRIIGGTISELHIYYDIEHNNNNNNNNNKTPSDVYSVVESTNEIAKEILEDSSYEN
ncbi:hypothetical protein MNB_SM-5-783 [hydrothermal vent metagenome]|uniref:Uncharacterized protein n=1 Tax=hydrothermal vent metagenome TaxID=652676 RepID=A0A1W1CAT3_9ZZZZ